MGEIKMLRDTMIFTFVFFILVCPIWAEEVLIDKDLWEKILQRQDALEKEVRQLKEQLKVITPVAEDIEYLKEDEEEISERLDTVETKSILDKILIGGEFRTTLEYLNFDNIIVDDQKKDGRTDELWSTRLRLNLRSEITDDIIFHGRLSYYKYWGETNSDISPSDDRHFMASGKKGNLHVERAYIDYFMPGTPFAVTIGRLPVSGGPPYEFKNYTTRKATWTQMFVDGEFDGIISSLSFDKWTGLKDTMLRLGYSKVDQNYRQYEGVPDDSTRVAFFSAEAEAPGVRDSLIWLGAYKLFDMSPLNIPGTDYPDDSGTYETYTLHLQFDDIKNSGLGWFSSFCYQNIHPRSEGTKLGPGYEVGLLGDSLNNDLGKRREGYAVYIGLRYILPVESLKHPHIGFEYNYGSKYWFPGALYGREFTNKLGVNGNAYEFYYIQPVSEKHMFCRFGIVYQDFDYYAPMIVFGSRESEEAKSDMTMLHTYFLLDVRF